MPTLTAGRVAGGAWTKRRGADGGEAATNGETGASARVEAGMAARGPCEDTRQIFAVIVH